MKRLTILSLAMVVAAAFMATCGVGSAAAITLCKGKTSGTCGPGERYPAGTTIAGSVTKAGAILTSSLGTVTCTSSTFSGKTDEESGNPLHAEVSALTFSSCNLGSTKCTVTSENLAYTETISASSITGNGTFVIETSGAGTPQAHVDCGVALNCIFAKKSTSLTVTGGNPATAVANQSMELIENEGFFCPSTSTWEANYEITSPKPLFIVASP